jgi:transcriptional regulator with XRE-family HTH domain
VTTMLSYSHIGKRIRQFRKERKLTLDQCSELSGISSQHLSHIESGTARLSLSCLVNIANVMNITPNELLLDSITADIDDVFLHKDIQRVFSDATPDEIRHMLAIASSLKQSLRISTTASKQ